MRGTPATPSKTKWPKAKRQAQNSFQTGQKVQYILSRHVCHCHVFNTLKQVPTNSFCATPSIQICMDIISIVCAIPCHRSAIT